MDFDKMRENGKTNSDEHKTDEEERGNLHKLMIKSDERNARR